MKKLMLSLVVALLLVQVKAQTIYPTHWWTGMKNPTLQLLLKEKEIGIKYLSVKTDYPGIKITGMTKVENPNYLFIDLLIQPGTPSGTVIFTLEPVKGKPRNFSYLLKNRSSENGRRRVMGINSSDVSYLLMPDRFANGDPSNDAFPALRDTQADRSNKFGRHGGDLKGIQDHLNYFNDLGVTALWFTPVYENDMPKEIEGPNEIAGYHGYWFTDHYRIDPRLGTNEEYRELVNAAHAKGIKIIQDAIYNHVGLWHWMYQDPPAKDWINQWPQFTGPNHHEETIFDPYASQYDRTNMLKGWFTPHLPDVNLQNPYAARYLIQHAIWSVEEFGFDGFRIDTYKYCDEEFVNTLNNELLAEFPTITTFVEAWVNTVTANAYFSRNHIESPFRHNAQGAIDFQLCFAMHAGMNQAFGWTEGVSRIYTTLAQDLLYKDPLNNCIFLDNHDMDRVYSVIGEDWNKMKWGINWLLTLRGIPQIYYGTEILMKNFKNPSDAEVRYDFPGGWPGDPVNKFSTAGRDGRENEAFSYFSKLLHFRKSSPALTKGNTTQFVIRDGVYVYFRYTADQTIMVITNTGGKSFKPDWSVYRERSGGFSKLRNVMTGTVSEMNDLSVAAGEGLILELVR